MPEISRGRALAYLVVLLVLLALGGRFLLGGSGAATSRPAGATAADAGSALEAEAPTPRTLIVHVVGAVRRPGLYELPEGSRVDEALRRAGGAKPKAALELVNLAAPVGDGQQIVVPLRAEAPGSSAETAAAAATSTAASAPVHLNSATLEQLDSLPGVGPVTAQKILDYRQEHGAFRSLEELDAVSGIGPARLEQLSEVLQL